MKPEDIPEDVALAANELWHELAACAPKRDAEEEFIARAIMAAKAEEREAIQALLAHGAPHSPRRYIYDNTADRRIWACDKLDEAIRQRGTP